MPSSETKANKDKKSTLQKNRNSRGKIKATFFDKRSVLYMTPGMYRIPRGIFKGQFKI